MKPFLHWLSIIGAVALIICLILTSVVSTRDRRIAKSKQKEAWARYDQRNKEANDLSGKLATCEEEKAKAQGSDMQRTVCRDGKVICRSLGAIKISPAEKGR